MVVFRVLLGIITRIGMKLIIIGIVMGIVALIGALRAC